MAERRPKRRRAALASSTLSLQEAIEARLQNPLKRSAGAAASAPHLNWLGRPQEEGGAQCVDEITEWHVKYAYGQSSPSCFDACMNKYRHVAPESQEPQRDSSALAPLSRRCSDAHCQGNILCLNYLGQSAWESEHAFKKWCKANNVTEAATLLPKPRQDDLPVGLRNLGATCYVNALLQVWFHNLPFRRALYLIEDKDHDSLVSHFQRIFAQMQMSRRSVCDPEPLIRRLGLDIHGHQDAQEFSSLCMQSLEVALKTSSAASAKDIVASLFEGRMSMGTRCLVCHKTSCSDTAFAELQLSLVNGAGIETLLGNILQSEHLTGENKYHCLNCSAMQEAERFCHIKELPPCLHLSLLRFTFDAKTLAKNKSHRRIKYPSILDMRPFVAGGFAMTTPLIYDLVAVLSHKGKESDWGHYVADVYSASAQRWYTFNDERVAVNEKLYADTRKREQGMTQINKYFTNASATAREISRGKPTTTTNGSEIPDQTAEVEVDSPEMTTSEAYLLVYAVRRDGAEDEPTVPDRLKEMIAQATEADLAEAQRVCDIEHRYRALFEIERSFKRDIYRTWSNPDAVEPLYFVPTAWLRDWCAQGINSPSLPALRQAAESVHVGQESNLSTSETFQTTADTTCASMRCSHGRMSLEYLQESKVISAKVFSAVQSQSTEIVHPISVTESCEQCCKKLLETAIFEANHQRHLQYFNAHLPANKDEATFLVSTPWLMEFLKAEPFQEISAPTNEVRPDNELYLQSTLCLHGEITPHSNADTWTAISNGQAQLLTGLYTDLELPRITEICTSCRLLCDAQKPSASASLQYKQLGHLLAPRLLQPQTALRLLPAALHQKPQEDYFMLSRIWFDGFVSWLRAPSRFAPPGPINNSSLMCEHGRLLFDPFDERLTDENPASYVLIREADWVLLKKYNNVSTPFESHESRHADRPIRAGSLSLQSIEGLRQSRRDDRSVVCDECASRRIDSYSSGTLFVLLDKSRITSCEPKPAICYVECVQLSTQNTARANARPLRRTKSLDNCPFPIHFSRSSTVKDLKVAIMKRTRIAPHHQELWFESRKLEESEMRITDLNLRPGDLLNLLEVDLEDAHASRVKSTAHMSLAGFVGTQLENVKDDIDEDSALQLALQASMEVM